MSLTVARKANVEFENIIGSVDALQDKTENIPCIAEGARPAGSFKWYMTRRGSSEAIQLQNTNQPEVFDDQNGFVSMREV